MAALEDLRGGDPESNWRDHLASLDAVDGADTGPEPFAFNAANPPPESDAVLTLGGTPVLTPGNFATLGGGEKVGKSALFGGIQATAFNPDADGLGFRTSNPEGMAILSFDLEQSLADFHRGVMRSLRRANLNDPPEWFYAYSLAAFTPEDAFATIQRLSDQAAERHGGVSLILIDGFADLQHGVNDEEESFETVRRIMEMARSFDCGILGVLHQNPSGDFAKMRGHLGSQCQRKGETYLVAKSSGEGIFSVYTERSRGAPVPEIKAPRYQWNEDAGMFTSVKSKAAEVADQKSKDAWDVACQLAAGNRWKSWRHNELVADYVELTGKSPETAKRWIRGQKHHDPSAALKFNAATGYYSIGVMPQKMIEEAANPHE